MLRKTLLAFIAVFIVWIFCWALFVPKESVSQKVTKKIEEQKKKADFFMKGVTFSEIVNGVKYWEIKSLTSEINKDTGKAILNDVKGTFFKEGKESFRFISPRVFWGMNIKEIRIDSPLGFDKRYRFETKDLNWSVASNRISTSSEVVFEGRNISIRAKGLTGDTGLEKMSLAGRPHAQIQTGKETMHIEADSFELDGNSNTVAAAGKAFARRGGLFLTSGSMVFDNRQNILRAGGGVKVSFRDIKAEADEASYDAKKDVVVLSGSASGERGDSRLRGARLKIDIKNNKISIEGKSRVVIEDELLTPETN